MSDYSPRGQNRDEIDRRLAATSFTDGSEGEQWREVVVNVAGALAYALGDVADAIRDHAEGGYTKPVD